MPNYTQAVTVGATPVKVAAAKPPQARSWMTLAVPASTIHTVYYALGVAGVTPSSGTPLYPGDILTVENSTVAKQASHELWAVTTSGTVNVIIAEGG